ncbi:unnamed protein product [Rotaria socialis]|uniref:Uncharacterized protein n=1 Tax=Rotaria socialis TaxID=392032 RepID=A0A818BAV9_9BILA|nr:unnamed protein product [Rotaria socialis]
MMKNIHCIQTSLINCILDFLRTSRSLDLTQISASDIRLIIIQKNQLMRNYNIKLHGIQVSLEYECDAMRCDATLESDLHEKSSIQRNLEYFLCRHDEIHH